MKCPYCKSSVTRVIDKRDNDETNVTRRRRECDKCNKRFTTYERIENVLLNVKKRDGSIEEFNREKIKRGILLALKKREIPEENLEKILERLEAKLLKSEDQTIKSKTIGRLVLKELNKIDKLGALLFAAVYKDFKSLDEVEEELTKLSKST